MNVSCSLILALALTFGTGVASAQSTAAPASQAGVFAKVFKFTKAFRGKKIKLLGVYNSATQGDIETMMSAFSARGVMASAVTEADAEQSLGGIHVVYMLSSPGSLAPALVANKILSITGDTSLVEKAQMSVGVMDHGGKMVITVNLPRAKSEGHMFAPSFLKLTKVIR